MSSFDDAIWRHLVDRHGAERVEVPVPRVTRRFPPFAASAAVAGLAAAIAVVVLVLGGTTATPAAYALTANGDGTYTVSLTNLATGIPALNAKFKQLGIRETVIPIESNCTESELSGPFAYPGASMSETVTVGNKWLAPGQRGFLAAKQTPEGTVLLAIGSSANPLPPCFPEKPNNGTIIPHSS